MQEAVAARPFFAKKKLIKGSSLRPLFSTDLAPLFKRDFWDQRGDSGPTKIRGRRRSERRFFSSLVNGRWDYSAKRLEKYFRTDISFQV